MKVIKSATLLMALLLILSGIAYGQPSPPPEAYKACEGKSSGDVSQFVGPNGRTLTGICKEVDGKLVLQPDRPKGKSDGKSVGPPPGAYKACEGKSVGDASQFVSPRGETISGICKEVGGKLVLQPDRPKGKSGGKSDGPPAEAYKACEGKSAGDASQFVGPNGRTLTGICKEVDGKLVLRPDRPKAVN